MSDNINLQKKVWRIRHVNSLATPSGNIYILLLLFTLFCQKKNHNVRFCYKFPSFLVFFALRSCSSPNGDSSNINHDSNVLCSLTILNLMNECQPPVIVTGPQTSDRNTNISIYLVSFHHQWKCSG